MHLPFSLTEKRDVDAGMDASKTAEGMVGFASAHVLHNLIRPIKMPWESSPVLNPKRAFCSTLPNLGQSVVGMRDFACNVGNSEVSEATVVTLI